MNMLGQRSSKNSNFAIHLGSHVIFPNSSISVYTLLVLFFLFTQVLSYMI